VQVEAVVDGADDGDEDAAGQDPDEAVVRARGRLDEQQAGDERPGEDRQAAEQRRRLAAQAARLGLVDRADATGEPGRQRRQHRRHGEGRDERIDRVELRHTG
jgi:hypothetical protein